MALEAITSIGSSAISGLGAGATKPAPSEPSGGSLSFGSLLSEAEKALNQADVLAEQLATGELTDIAEFTTATAKAQLAVELTAAVRNQALEAFQEVMRMQL